MKTFNKKGFTLIELVIVTSIALLLLGSVYGLLHGSVTLWQKASGKIDLQQNARIAFNTIETDIKRADAVHISSSDNRVLLNIDNEIIGYHLSGSQILRTVLGQGNNPVAYSVSKLRFRYYPSITECLLVEVTMEFQNENQIYSLFSKINIRSANY